MIRIIATMKIKPGHKQQFIDFAQPLVAGSQAEEGNIAYNLCQSRGDENTLAFVEIWKDQAAIDFHNQTEHFKTAGAHFADLLACEAEVAFYLDVL